MLATQPPDRGVKAGTIRYRGLEGRRPLSVSFAAPDRQAAASLSFLSARALIFTVAGLAGNQRSSPLNGSLPKRRFFAGTCCTPILSAGRLELRAYPPDCLRARGVPAHHDDLLHAAALDSAAIVPLPTFIVPSSTDGSRGAS